MDDFKSVAYSTAPLLYIKETPLSLCTPFAPRFEIVCSDSLMDQPYHLMDSLHLVHHETK